MYIAKGTRQDVFSIGSTVLHEDITSAVNLMLWASDLPDGRPGYALWHIFTPKDSITLRAYLRKHVINGVQDPIHSQNIYLTPQILQNLEAAHSIKPYIIRQKTGDLVCIPAGCAHQVSCS